MKLVYWLILLTSLSSNARVFSENFSSQTQKESSTLIWNTELGILHPTLQIFGYRAPAQGAASQTTYSVGDGRDGAFELATYANFGTVVGNHITIDANIFPILNVTRFNLDSAYTISSINGPLVIYSLSTVTIDGVIQCFGNNGNAAVGAIGGAGGAGRCGGFSGGAGGNAASSGANGLPTTGNVTGGGGGIYTASVSGAGGGGGAAYVGLDGIAGFNSANPAANLGGNPGSGVSGIDHGFINLAGSAGGGGGCGSGSEGGSGGGAGGGTVIIHAVSAVTISNTGAILAYGGDGGASNGGGGGGGGGGGNIKVFTPANFKVASGATVSASEGRGATPVHPNAGAGGNGSFGRAWLVAGNYLFFGTITNSSTLADEGFTGFVSGTVQTATSKSYDTSSPLVTYQSITANNPSSDITFQVAGSSDNFASDDSGWINAAAISGIAKKRYIKYRISVNNSNALNPTFVSDVLITYDLGQKENFAFKSGGCGLVINAPPNSNLWLGSLLMFLPLIFAWRLRRPKTVRVRKEE